jgi:predicted TPR repeat methyltransferase
MVEMAARKGCYHALHVSGMLEFMRAEASISSDLVIAADAFVYVADLAPLFCEIARALVPRGMAAFTVEAHDGPDAVLGPSLRYAHGEPLLRDGLAVAGLRLVRLERASTREEAGRPVPGFVAVATKN